MELQALRLFTIDSDGIDSMQAHLYVAGNPIPLTMDLSSHAVRSISTAGLPATCRSIMHQTEGYGFTFPTGPIWVQFLWIDGELVGKYVDLRDGVAVDHPHEWTDEGTANEALIDTNWEPLG